MSAKQVTVTSQVTVTLNDEIPERTAITEIRALEENLSNARAVKAGMMSALLTGRVRLV